MVGWSSSSLFAFESGFWQGSNPAIYARSNQYRPFYTGVQGIDFDVPIGRGQTMLFQGTDPVMDKKKLWPDLLRSEPVVGVQKGLPVNVVVCRDFDEAKELRGKLQDLGCWERCTIFVPISDDPASRRCAFLEHDDDDDKEQVEEEEEEQEGGDDGGNGGDGDDGRGGDGHGNHTVCS
eukprot:s4942_g1.t1